MHTGVRAVGYLVASSITFNASLRATSASIRPLSNAGASALERVEPVEDIQADLQGPTSSHSISVRLRRLAGTAISSLKEDRDPYTAGRSPEGALVHVLREIQQDAIRTNVNIKPNEYAALHQSLILAPEAIPFDVKDQHFRFSVESFESVLKYAAKKNDLATLRSEGRNAFAWLGQRRYPIQYGVRSRHRLRWDRKHLRGLLRNLILSTEIRMGHSLKAKELRGDPDKLTQSRKQTGALHVNGDVRSEDDVQALRSLLRRRVGVMKRAEGPDEGDGDGTGIERDASLAGTDMTVSRFARSARHFPFRQPRVLRRINLLAQRNLLSAFNRRATITEVKPRQGKNPTAEVEHEYVTSKRLDRLLDGLLKGKESKNEADSTIGSPDPQLLERGKRIALRRWRRKGKNVISVRARVFKALSALPRPSATADDGMGSIKVPMTPTWLLLDALYSCSESGYPKMAQSIILRYLSDLQRRSGVDAKEIYRQLPTGKMIKAVTEPHKPPNSSSLLNAVLRAHLTAGKSHTLPQMLNTMQIWCLRGERFAEAVSEAAKDGAKGNRTSNIARSQEYLPCLYPDETSLVLLIEASKPSMRQLTRSGVSQLRGLTILEEMWRRWAPVHVQPKSFTDDMPSFARPLRLTVRSFRTLLRQAIAIKSRQCVDGVLASYETWMQRSILQSQRARFGLVPASNSVPPNVSAIKRSSFSVRSTRVKRERMLWIDALRKAVDIGLLDVTRAEQLMRDWDFIPSYTSFRRSTT